MVGSLALNEATSKIVLKPGCWFLTDRLRHLQRRLRNGGMHAVQKDIEERDMREELLN